jgi:hypothetical protein
MLITHISGTEYIITAASGLVATLTKHYPSAEDQICTFNVPAYDLGPIEQIDDLTGELVGEYDPTQPKNRRQHDAEFEDSLDAKFAWRN